MEDDQELLRLAAKAAGIEGHIEADGLILHKRIGNTVQMGQWNPLQDTDEALALAEKLGLKISLGNGGVCVSIGDYSVLDDTSVDSGAGLRRSIVRAAAQVGKLPR